jgi:hypothetical protein
MTHLERAREPKHQNASKNPVEEHTLRPQQVAAVAELVAELVAAPVVLTVRQ